MEPDAWADCEFLTYVNRYECVLRVISTGAIVLVRLAEPLNVSRACLISPLKTVPCRARLEGFLNDDECEIDVQWPTEMAHPPRSSYPSRKRHKP
jgi:hypothetical protein